MLIGNKNKNDVNSDSSDGKSAPSLDDPKISNEGKEHYSNKGSSDDEEGADQI
jgi:hypothetical protein